MLSKVQPKIYVNRFNGSKNSYRALNSFARNSFKSEHKSCGVQTWNESPYIDWGTFETAKPRGPSQGLPLGLD